MENPGFKIIKFRGLCWTFSHHCQSKDLGRWLVDNVPADPEQYQKWLQSQRDTFTKWDSLLQEFLTIHPEDMPKLHSDEAFTPVFQAAFDDRLYDDTPPSYRSVPTHHYLTWAYTIDLDREVFSVRYGAHFRLNHIPRNNDWEDAIHEDTHGNLLVLPRLVPAESVATLALCPPSFKVSANYAKLQTRIVKPKNPDLMPRSIRTGPKLWWMLFYHFSNSQRKNLSVSLLSWRAQDLPLRELAFFILCLAKSGEHLALIDMRLLKLPYSMASYVGVKTQCTSEIDIELVSLLGHGYHMAGLPKGSAPEETKYWFEGALICLVPRLDYPGNLEAAIADAMEYGRASCKATSFNAILMSIEHLVLIRSLPDGIVEHTELMPLIPIPMHVSKDSRARYSDEELDAFYTAKRDIIEPLAEDSEKLDVKSAETTEGNRKRGDSCAVTDTANDDDGIDEVERMNDSTRTTFMALIQFFEATTLETLRRSEQIEARIPDELSAMVLQNVDDMKTYNACMKVSRSFRLACQRRTLVMDNIVFLEPPERDPALSISREKEEDTHDPQPRPDFLAVEVSSNRQMDVWLRIHQTHNEDLDCLIVAGKELNRKTYDLSVVFQGLHIPLPGFDEADTQMIDADEADTQMMDAVESEPERQPMTYGSEGTTWESAFRAREMTVESELQEFYLFWFEVIRGHGLCMELCRDPEWTYPPYTMSCLTIQQAVRHYKEGKCHVMFFTYVYLRLKQQSRYWTNQWDDIIREATDHLNRPDDYAILRWGSPKGEVLGADEPFVILAVGLQVRIFKWYQGFDPSVDETAKRQASPASCLGEFFPYPDRQILDLRNQEDRMMVDAFLNLAKEHARKLFERLMSKCGGWYQYNNNQP